MSLGAKICGLSTPEAVQAAVAGGAAYVGFNVVAGSPRYVEPRLAGALAEPLRAAGIGIVAVTADASDALLDAVAAALRPDLIQLHGEETPARAAAVRARAGVGVIRALRVGEAGDLAAAAAFEDVADHLMFDARPPAGATRTGGNGAVFDWSLLAGRRFARPWFLAGGLTAANVGEATRTSGAPLVDVSSGVETAPGVKDPALIAAFLQAVRRA